LCTIQREGQGTEAGVSESSTSVFKTAAFNRSATTPGAAHWPRVGEREPVFAQMAAELRELAARRRVEAA
jgi:hypothetical protein